jgi:hypothetical protein
MQTIYSLRTHATDVQVCSNSIIHFWGTQSERSLGAVNGLRDRRRICPTTRFLKEELKIYKNMHDIIYNNFNTLFKAVPSSKSFSNCPFPL